MVLALQIVFAFLASVCVYGIYEGVRTKWPENYAYSYSPGQEIGRQTFLGYVAFRFVPSFISIGLFSVVSERHGGSSWRLFVIFILIHLFFVISDSIRNWRKLSKYQIRVIVFVFDQAVLVLGAFVAVLLSGYFAALVPGDEELLGAVWTAVLLSAIYYAFKRYSGSIESGVSFKERLVYKLGTRVREYLDEEVDTEHRNLIEGILLAEVSQRPKWLRVIENVFLRVFSKGGYVGTSGIAQMKSVRVLSDLDSVRKLHKDFLKWLEAGNDSITEAEKFDQYIVRHNPDPGFLESVKEFMLSRDAEIPAAEEEYFLPDQKNDL